MQFDEKTTYPFYWLDELAEVSLNPTKKRLSDFTKDYLLNVCQRLPDEFARIEAVLKQQTFSLYCGDHIKVVAGHYDHALWILKRQVMSNMEKYPQKGLLRRTGEMMKYGIEHLMNALQQRCATYLPAKDGAVQNSQDQFLNPINKVICALSADQIGITLRAANEVSLLTGRSFRSLCQIVGPYLSTPWSEEIKAETLRSHAGRPEVNDKLIVIAFLEKMIAKIKDYR